MSCYDIFYKSSFFCGKNQSSYDFVWYFSKVGGPIGLLGLSLMGDGFLSPVWTPTKT